MDSFRFFRTLVSSKVIVDNGIAFANTYCPKKKAQILIETWHGSLGIKRFDRQTNKDRWWIHQAEKEAAYTDYIISNSDFEDKIYRDSFWTKSTIWKFGHPRNDILFCRDEEKIRKLDLSFRKKYHIPEDAKLCLYGPTFRDDKDTSPYAIDYDQLRNALEVRFGGKWVIMTRFHFRVRVLLENCSLPDDIIDVSGYPDIQDILCLIDVGITDYSSWICEYMLRRKAGFMFATDMATYESSNRKLFFPLEKLPFPVAYDETTLFDNIKGFNEEKFKEDCDSFLTEMGSIDDGHASERVVDELVRIMGME